MKILKIFGVVVGIHVFALMLIFAIPGCSSTSRPIPAPTDTLPVAEAGPTITVPMSSSTVSVPGSPPADFNPDAPAVAASSGPRYTPTRPNTPVAATLVSEPVVDVTPATTYTVMSGDNLWTLSKRFNVSTAQLAAANNIRVNAIIRPGQKLIIPGKPASSSAAATADPAAAAPKTAETVTTPRSTGETVRHVVKPGETLSEIAQHYGVRQGDIAVANNITDPQRIRANTELIIPGWLATKSGKAAERPAPKATAPKQEPPPLLNVEPEPAPTLRPDDVPVIRVDENPISPAPRNP